MSANRLFHLEISIESISRKGMRNLGVGAAQNARNGRAQAEARGWSSASLGGGGERQVGRKEKEDARARPSRASNPRPLADREAAGVHNLKKTNHGVWAAELRGEFVQRACDHACEGRGARGASGERNEEGSRRRRRRRRRRSSSITVVVVVLLLLLLLLLV